MNEQNAQKKQLKKILLTQEYLSEIDALKINYALELIKNEGIKTLLFMAFFLLINRFSAFLLCMGILCTVRIFSGGIHMKTNIGCFLLSSAFLLLEIIFLPTLPLSEQFYLVLLLISVLIICLLSPIPSYKRPIKSRKKYRYCKRLSIIFSITWGIVLLIAVQDPFIKYCGIWTLSLQALQLVLQLPIRYFNRTLTYSRRFDNV